MVSCGASLPTATYTDESEYVQKYRMLIANFYFHYAMLTINAFGLQNSLERSAVDIGHFFARCHSSAVSCATILRDEMGPLGYLKYAPDSHFVMGSYAVLSLLKVRHAVRGVSPLADVNDAI